MPAFALGIDIGGTQLRAAVFDAAGARQGEFVIRPTLADGPVERTIASLYDAVDGALDSAPQARAEIVGIGVGSTGPIDPQSGAYGEPLTLPQLFGYPLGPELAERYGLPVRVTNDGNAFALAESRAGIAKGHSIVIGVTLGTGCGVGCVIDGRVLEGATANSGEVYKARLPGGTFDERLSGLGLEQRYLETAGRRRSGREVSALASARDADALAAFKSFGHDVGEGLGTLAAVLDPGIIVLGGSVSAALVHFDKALRNRFAQRVAPEVAAAVEIAPGTLGASAGALGGAALHFSGSAIR